jgi:hypothetical protein
MPFLIWDQTRRSYSNCKGNVLTNRLFLHLEHSKRPTSLSKLVEAFGWTRETTYVQQDIQEFCCLLMDNLEKKFEDKKDFVNPFANSPVQSEDPAKNLIKSLFNGKTEQVISCRDVDFQSTRKEDFIDIQLSLKSFTKTFNTIEESLMDFLAKEELTGDNKYATDQWGKQDADRRVRFFELPKVLMFHLRRCEFDYQTETNKKIKHRFEFPQILDMNNFRDPEMQIEGGNPYKLYCIFVHHGHDGIAGHYTVLLKEDDEWYEFDDEQAKHVNWEFVKLNSFGGENPELTVENKNLKLISKNKKTLSHAYMIIYIDQRYEKEMLGSVNTENLVKASQSLQNSINKKMINLDSSFVKRSLAEKSFPDLSYEIRDSNKRYYLEKMISFTIFSIWHFLGEPCGKGALFSKDTDDSQYSVQPIKNLQKLFDMDSLVSILNQSQKIKKILISDQKESTIQSKSESELKALNDPIKENIIVEEEDHSPRKLITDGLELTPDYLNFFPSKVQNVLVKLKHLIPENIIEEVHDAKCMINLDEILDVSKHHCSETYFETIVSNNLSLLTLKMHIFSLILSKPNRTAFGLSNLEIDPMVRCLILLTNSYLLTQEMKCISTSLCWMKIQCLDYYPCLISICIPLNPSHPLPY